MTRLAFVDVETTGDDPLLHELWEIGIILRDTSKTRIHGREPEYAWHVFPDLSKAQPRALQVNRYYERCRANPLDGAVIINHPDDTSGRRTATTSSRVVAAEVALLLADAVLVAVNVDFDAAFLTKFLRAHGQCPTWDYHKVEVLSLAAGHLHMPPPWTSTTITDALGVANEKDRHTGLGDARIVRDVYDRVYTPAA